jgi:hypothetical protein
MYQKKYWNQLKELRVHVYYVQLYAEQQSRYDHWLNIFLAVTSSSSIAAWAIWTEYQMVWACIIASSQVIAAVKHLLPYKKRLNALNKLGDILSLIALKAEKDWFYVSEGTWDEEQIHSRWVALKEDALSAENKSLNGVTIPKNKRLLIIAENDADVYLNSAYN